MKRLMKKAEDTKQDSIKNNAANAIRLIIYNLKFDTEKQIEENEKYGFKNELDEELSKLFTYIGEQLDNEGIEFLEEDINGDGFDLINTYLQSEKNNGIKNINGYSIEQYINNINNNNINMKSHDISLSNSSFE